MEWSEVIAMCNDVVCNDVPCIWVQCNCAELYHAIYLPYAVNEANNLALLLQVHGTQNPPLVMPNTRRSWDVVDSGASIEDMEADDSLFAVRPRRHGAILHSALPQRPRKLRIYVGAIARWLGTHVPFPSGVLHLHTWVNG